MNSRSLECSLSVALCWPKGEYVDKGDRGEEPTHGAAPLTVRDLQEQARQLKDAQGFHVSLEQRLSYSMVEVGELAEEVLKLSGVKGDEGDQAKETLGLEIYDVVWNLFDLADLAGVDLEEAFARKVAFNRDRTW
jgi:NTP pyrophosphatase (non-canonical NTP hydrolase)